VTTTVHAVDERHRPEDHAGDDLDHDDALAELDADTDVRGRSETEAPDDADQGDGGAAALEAEATALEDDLDRVARELDTLGTDA